MLIVYRGERVSVEVITYDESDSDMAWLVWFPKDHPLYDPDGVWLETKDLTIIERR